MGIFSRIFQRGQDGGSPDGRDGRDGRDGHSEEQAAADRDGPTDGTPEEQAEGDLTEPVQNPSPALATAVAGATGAAPAGSPFSTPLWSWPQRGAEPGARRDAPEHEQAQPGAGKQARQAEPGPQARASQADRPESPAPRADDPASAKARAPLPAVSKRGAPAAAAPAPSPSKDAKDAKAAKEPAPARAAEAKAAEAKAAKESRERGDSTTVMSPPPPAQNAPRPAAGAAPRSAPAARGQAAAPPPASATAPAAPAAPTAPAAPVPAPAVKPAAATTPPAAATTPPVAATTPATPTATATAAAPAPTPAAAAPATAAAEPAAGAPRRGHPDTLSNVLDEFVLELQAEIGSAGIPASGLPTTAHGVSTADDLAAVRGLFNDVAVAHVAQVRDVMLELHYGDADPKWIEMTRPALRSLRAMAEQLELADLCAALDAFCAAADAAVADRARVTEDDKAELQRRYARLVELIPQAFELDAERDRREPIIVEALLSQVPGVELPTIEKLLAVGLGRLDALMSAKADEIAVVAGLRPELAAAIAEQFRTYRANATAAVSAPDPAAEFRQLGDLLILLCIQNDDFTRASNEWSDEAQQRKRQLRRQREQTFQQIKVALARLGAREQLQRLEKLPFQERITVLDRFLSSQQPRPST